MKVSYPVVFCRNGAEFAATVIKASIAGDRPPTDPTANATRRQRLSELRVDLAFFDTHTRTWCVAENVRYISLDQEVPADGEVYYETGAPDPAERAAMIAEHQAQLERAGGSLAGQLGAKAAGDGGAIKGSNPDKAIVDELEQPATAAERELDESIDAGLEADAGDRAEIRMESEGGPASAELVERQGRIVRTDDPRIDELSGTQALETKPIG